MAVGVAVALPPCLLHLALHVRAAAAGAVAQQQPGGTPWKSLHTVSAGVGQEWVSLF